MNREELKARVLWAIDQVCKQDTPAFDEGMGMCLYETEFGSYCIAGWFYKDTEIWEVLRGYYGSLDDFNNEYDLLDSDSTEFKVIYEMQGRHDAILDPKNLLGYSLRDALMEVFYKYFPEEKVVASNT